MRKHSILAVSSLVATATVNSYAADMLEYDSKAFSTAQAQGRTIVLAFHKDGCATCASQDPKVRAVLKPMDSTKVVGFVVKFDADAAPAKQYGVVKQSTLVVLKGETVKAKELGLTDEAKIRALVNKGL